MAFARLRKRKGQISQNTGKRNIVLGTVLGYVSLGLTILFGLVFTPWVIATIGQSQYGLFTLSGSIISLFAVDFGLGITANSFLARYKAEGDTEGETRFLAIVYKLYLILDAALLTIFVVFYFLIEYVYAGLTPAEKADLKTVYLVSASFSVIAFPATLFNGVLQSSERFAFLKITDIAAKLFYVIGSIAALSLGWGLFGLVTAQAIGNLLAIIMKYIYMRFVLKTRMPLFRSFKWADAKPIIKFSLLAGIVGICSRLVFSITPSILGVVSDSNNIAYFGVVVVLEGYIYIFGSVTNGFFLPKISRILKEENSAGKILQLAIKIGRYQIFILGLAEIGFICCGDEFITAWMHGSTEYFPAYVGTILVMLYQLVDVPEVVFHDAMYHSNKTMKHLAIATATKAALNLVLAFPLSYWFGVYGACIAIFIARATSLIMQNIFYQKDLGIDSRVFFAKTYRSFLFAGPPALAIGLALHFLLPLDTLPKLFVIAVAVIAIYCGIYYFVAEKEVYDPAVVKIQSIVSSKGKFVQKAIAPMAFAALMAFLCYGGSRIAFDPNYGISGTYVFQYEGQTVETIRITLWNEYVHTYFYNSEQAALTEPRVVRYRWKSTIQWLEHYSDPESIADLDYVSDYQIQVCNDSWASYYQYFFLDGVFYTKQNYPEYGGKQKCYIKQ